MSALSNLFRPRDAGPPVYRAVVRGEIEQAMRLIVGNSRGSANDEQVLDFLSFALDRGIDVNDTWIADVGGRVEWALLPVVSPGKTMLLFTPTCLPRREHPEVVQGCAESICRHFAARGVVMAQLLIDPAEAGVLAAYEQSHFRRLAELYYLQANIRGNEPMPETPAGWMMTSYLAENHDLFADVITRSYEGSMDCPDLNGVRNVDDVIAGHKAAGDFDPRLWFLLSIDHRPAAVLLLNRSQGNTAVELVYLGVANGARRRGMGDWLVKWALAISGLEGRRYLSLAVDSKNVPALRLYYRHGMVRIGARVAMVRDLRELAKTSSETGFTAVKPG